MKMILNDSACPPVPPKFLTCYNNITILMQSHLLIGKRNFQPIALYKKLFNVSYIAINKVHFYEYVKVSVSKLRLGIGSKSSVSWKAASFPRSIEENC